MAKTYCIYKKNTYLCLPKPNIILTLNSDTNMNATLLFLGLGTQEIVIIAIVVLLLFGGKKIPELMKGLGKGVKSFKDGVNGIEESINESIDKAGTPNEEQKK